VRNVQKTLCLPVNVGMRFLHNSVVELEKDALWGVLRFILRFIF